MKTRNLLSIIMLVVGVVLAGTTSASAGDPVCFSDPDLPCIGGDAQEAVDRVVALLNGEVPCLDPHGPDP